jgi:hypothetical protein
MPDAISHDKATGDNVYYPKKCANDGSNMTLNVIAH